MFLTRFSSGTVPGTGEGAVSWKLFLKKFLRNYSSRVVVQEVFQITLLCHTKKSSNLHTTLGTFVGQFFACGKLSHICQLYTPTQGLLRRLMWGDCSEKHESIEAISRQCIYFKSGYSKFTINEGAYLSTQVVDWSKITKHKKKWFFVRNLRSLRA